VNNFDVSLVKAQVGGVTRAKPETGGIKGRKKKLGKGVAEMKTFGISRAKLDKRVEWDISG
jgi:hypothetical protein